MPLVKFYGQPSVYFVDCCFGEASCQELVVTLDEVLAEGFDGFQERTQLSKGYI